MPKMKSHRGAAKRFLVTPTGRVMRRKATGNHMLIKKSGSQKRRISGMAEVGPEAKNIRGLLAGGKSRRRPSSPPPGPTS